MWSKNKARMTQHEHDWVENIKAMACGVCGLPALLPDRPSEAHELEQGLWFTSIPLCADCHRGKRNGIHGEKRMWAVYKLDELKVLNETLRKVMT